MKLRKASVHPQDMMLWGPGETKRRCRCPDPTHITECIRSSPGEQSTRSFGIVSTRILSSGRIGPDDS